jgi:trk system potassium uptake protein TrkH
MSDRLQRKRICPVFSLHYKVVTSTTIFLIIIGLLTLLVAESHNPNTIANFNWGDKIMTSLFQSITPRTAGFNTVDIGKMTNSGLLILIALMFLGASPGGTGGGIKTTTARILLNSTKAAFQGKDEVLCYQRQIPNSLIIKAIGVVFGSALLVVISTAVIAMMEKIDLIKVLFEVVSAFATVGLSTGITASLSTPSELVLIATMYIGRVSVLLLMAAIFGDSKSTSIQYPEENLLV